MTTTGLSSRSRSKYSRLVNGPRSYSKAGRLISRKWRLHYTTGTLLLSTTRLPTGRVMILHPGLKKRWIEKSLDKEHAQYVFSTFTKFFDDEYNKLDLRDNQLTDQAQPSYLIDDDFYDKPEDLTQKDELTSYF
ncbi:hypothetical protein BHE90_017244 [Fusarium euwallaceae]|uniref:Uncharacterized protein n=1 Tax=Fusarium euwallaceae TaxID=1147111 RepID=A0A430KY05_9HYPO|nr:hypothetical protein BHE90_017244 [Fusarium euwallaceae]